MPLNKHKNNKERPILSVDLKYMENPKCVRVSEFAESPLDGIDKCVSVENQRVPDVSSLKPEDVLIEVRADDEWPVPTHASLALYAGS